jgi:hypothetical protein
MLIACAAALTRGPWIDEFWTLFAIDPGLPLGVALRQRWLTDVHPPLFYFVSRLVADVLGGDVPILRLQNAVAMACLLAFFLYANAAWLQARRFLLVYAVLAFSSYFATGYFAEYRSYYVQFVCGICFSACAYALLRGDMLAGVRQRHAAIAIFALTAVLLVNLHFVTALLTAISLGGMAGIALLRHQRRLATQIIVLGFIAGLPLAGTLWFQAPSLLGKVGGHFWIHTGPMGALRELAGSIAKGIGLNLAACALATGVWSRRPASPSADVVIGTGFLLITSVSMGLLLIVNSFMPIIVDRYLLLCSVLMICGVSILAKDAAFSLRLGFPLILANAILFLAVAGYKLINEPRWNATAAIIASRVAACPSSTIAAVASPPIGALPAEARVFALGYNYLARRYGFHVQMARPGQAYPADRCPTVLWIEHVNWQQPQPDGPDALVRDIVRRQLLPINLTAGVVQRTKTGALITLPVDSGR